MLTTQMKKTDWNSVAKFVPEWELYREELEAFDLQRLDRIGPLAFQEYLYVLVRHFDPMVIVESGVRHGPSTVINIAAMTEGAHLYSCDPCHGSQAVAAQKIKKTTGFVLVPEAWTFYGERSDTAFKKMPDVWDFFIHDSDHGAKNVAFEMETAWDRVRPGGVIVCDDFESCANAKKHRAFFEFCEKVEQQHYRIGTAAFLIKPNSTWDYR